MKKKRKRAAGTLQLDSLAASDQRKPKMSYMGVGKGIDSPVSTTNPQTDDEAISEFAMSRGDTGTHTPVLAPAPRGPNNNSNGGSTNNHGNNHMPNSNHATDASDAHSARPSAPAAMNLSVVSAEHNRAMLAAAFDSPLKGLRVVVIHVKDTFADGPLVGTQILSQLKEGESALQEQGKGLGCQFEVSRSGESYWF